MKSSAGTMLFVTALVTSVVMSGAAQDKPDPRIGLKPGLKDAGESAKGVERIATVRKPAGFFDPAAPAGEPTPPETPAPATPATPAEPATAATPAAPTTPAAPVTPAAPATSPAAAAPATTPPAPVFNGLNFANSDLAFRASQMFVGNFSGFNTYDVRNAREPRLIGSVVCPGGQGDVSIHGNLLFMSVEQTRGRVDCGTQGVEAPVSGERFRGVRVFDISDIAKPKQLAAVQTCRGSHTHTLVVDPDDKENVYIYGSGTGAVRSAEELAGCSGLDPKEDPNTALFSIDVIQVPLAAPENAKIINRPRIFADPKTGAVSGLWQGGDHGPGTQKTSLTNQCHDITVFPAAGLAAGACSGNGILLDISDPVHPVRLDQVDDKNFAYWHSATFNNDGTKVIFTDEWGGGTRPRCRATDPPTWGADAIFDIVDKKLKFGSYYKLPVAQTDVENCVAHNGSIIPVPGRDIMVQGWYQGGISIFDFTDSTRPVEIAFFDRGPVDAARLITAGHWSAYWYNGHIYGTEIARGVDVLRLKPTEFLSQNEIEAANAVRLPEFNPQQQPHVSFPATVVVARAYLDGLNRSKSIEPAKAAALKTALDKQDRAQLTTLAEELETAAAAATVSDASRLRALAATIKALPVKGR